MTDKETLEELKAIYGNILFAVRLGDLSSLIQLSGARNMNLADTYKDVKETYKLIEKEISNERKGS